MNKKTRIVKLFIILLAISIAVVSFLYEVRVAKADECHAKSCEIEYKDCVCCLITSGTVTCSPCGAYDCKPPAQ